MGNASWSRRNLARLLISFALVVSPIVFSRSAYAQNPSGVITMTIQDLTTGSTITQSTSYVFAPVVNTGDELQYQVLLSNQGSSPGNDQMVNTVVTNQLPAGLSLVSEDNLNVGTLDASQQAYLNIFVTVTATSAGLIQNQACFTGNSITGSSPQSGCATSFVKASGKAGTSSGALSTAPVPSGGGQGGDTSASSAPLPGTGSTYSAVLSALGFEALAGTSYIYLRARHRRPV